MRKSFLFILIAAVSGFAGAFVFHLIQPKQVVFQAGNTGEERSGTFMNVGSHAGFNSGDEMVKACQVATPCVVFIKTLTRQSNYVDPFFDFWNNMDFFGRRGPVSSSGSGVIISNDGYIVTNFHVVKDADQIDVITNGNKRSYSAKVIGTDPSTDLALLKIEAKNLSHISFGNSDNCKIGEWVLAVGNPFNLTSTVTAGIVSAKGRNINIVNNQFPIESFIQTDAAINPGNSGGALVNTSGELVGINTAIASNTGSYNGYGFAIPSNIVQKIVKDLIEFNDVQRGFTGMDVIDVDSKIAEKLNINDNNGVYVQYVLPKGPADNAGIKQGDLIVKANGKTIDSKSIFDEEISYFRPGDKVKISVLSNGKETETYLTLMNKEGNTAVLKKSSIASNALGAEFEMISKIETDKYRIRSGVRIFNIRGGRIRQMGIPEGFIITQLNRKEFSSAKELVDELEKVRGQVLIEGMYPNGGRGFYSFYF
ncbi:MAG: S1C family serine protease [Bacteroidia bacterium]